jgi:hypothetical protein
LPAQASPATPAQVGPPGGLLPPSDARATVASSVYATVPCAAVCHPPTPGWSQTEPASHHLHFTLIKWPPPHLLFRNRCFDEAPPTAACPPVSPPLRRLIGTIKTTATSSILCCTSSHPSAPPCATPPKLILPPLNHLFAGQVVSTPSPSDLTVRIPEQPSFFWSSRVELRASVELASPHSGELWSCSILGSTVDRSAAWFTVSWTKSTSFSFQE